MTDGYSYILEKSEAFVIRSHPYILTFYKEVNTSSWVVVWNNQNPYLACVRQLTEGKWPEKVYELCDNFRIGLNIYGRNASVFDIASKKGITE